MIFRFVGKYRELSNFEPAVIEFGHMLFPTVEHAFVAAKSLDLKFRRVIAVIPADKTGAARKLGRTVELRSDWEKVKLKIMEDLLMQKFDPKNILPVTQVNPNYEVLKSTGNERLVEGNYWHDNFWGDCACSDCKKIEGKNHLGLLLMKVREYYSLNEK
jgi:ribA/ribD-fused uncharacterized protein